VKVTFLEDVPKVARVGQTKMVADGFARNYLLPRKLAVIADSRAAAAIEGQLKKKVKQRELEDAEMAVLAEKIEGTVVTIKAKVGENEKLYGSVTAADIAGALTGAAGREFEKRQVELAEPIRQTGSHAVTIRLAHDITATISVNVISEEAVEAPAEVVVEAEKPARKPRAEKPEVAEGAEKPAKKPRAKSTKKAKPAEAVEKAPAPEASVEETVTQAAEPEAEEKATGE
jgi:large subunit ribosomal protein L9